MIPVSQNLSLPIEESVSPTRTYKILLWQDRMSGYTDDVDALIQAIYLILNTERYKFLIYSWDYGIELFDLIGQPIPYVMSEIKRRVIEALTQDDRVIDVTNFEFEQGVNKLHVKFDVNSIYGVIEASKEVVI